MKTETTASPTDTKPVSDEELEALVREAEGWAMCLKYGARPNTESELQAASACFVRTLAAVESLRAERDAARAQESTPPAPAATAKGRSAMPEAEIELEVTILNLTYRLRGFDAIRDLKLWLDEHASNVETEGCYVPTPTPTTAPPGEAVG